MFICIGITKASDLNTVIMSNNDFIYFINVAPDGKSELTRARICTTWMRGEVRTTRASSPSQRDVVQEGKNELTRARTCTTGMR